MLVTLFFWFGHAWNLTGTFLGSQVPLVIAWIVLAVVGVVVGGARRPVAATREHRSSTW